MVGADEFAWPGDTDLDADVDFEDYSRFLTCFNGPSHPAKPDCTVDADYDNDGDVDLDDYGQLLLCYNGPNDAPTCQ